MVAVNTVKAHVRSRGIHPLILNGGTGYRWVLKFTARLLLRLRRTLVGFRVAIGSLGSPASRKALWNKSKTFVSANM
jgi:hypothetical protein